MIAEYINNRRQNTAQITADDVTSVLNEVAEELRPLSVAKRVAAIVCGIHRADRDSILEQWRHEGLSAAADTALEQVEKEVSELRSSLSERVAEVEASINEHWERSKA